MNNMHIDWTRLFNAPRIRMPAPEKYPGQRTAYLKNSWRGDGVPSKMGTNGVTRQMRRSRQAGKR